MKKSQQLIHRFRELKLTESDDLTRKIKSSNYKKQFKFKALQKFRGKSLQKLNLSQGHQNNLQQEGIEQDQSMSSSLEYFSFGQILQ